MQRRHLLIAAGGIAFAAAPGFAQAAPVRLAAAWACGRAQRVGVIGVAGARAAVLAQIEVPTRAHGLLTEPEGSLLAVARRPGDWLLRWRADGQVLKRHWIEAQRSFNGHLLRSRDGRRLFGTETDTESGRSLIGVRDAATLEKIDEWPTHGLDAHQLLLDDAGDLIVANGGVPAQADTGRMKLAGTALDASLVRLDARSGALRGQWRLADSHLSPRHLAWGAPDARGRPTLGVALQAEHDDAADRASAPLLALFDGEQLRTAAQPNEAALAGYGGDIAWHRGHWVVSCPRADALAVWQADGRWRLRQPARAVCALASDAGALWCSGAVATAWHDDGPAQDAALADTTLRLDNHWLRLPA